MQKKKLQRVPGLLATTVHVSKYFASLILISLPFIMISLCSAMKYVLNAVSIFVVPGLSIELDD